MSRMSSQRILTSLRSTPSSCIFSFSSFVNHPLSARNGDIISPLSSSFPSSLSCTVYSLIPNRSRPFSSHTHSHVHRHHSHTPQPIAWYTSTLDQRTGKLRTIRSDKQQNIEHRLHHHSTTNTNGSGTDVTFIFAHATGFCGHVFTPLMEKLAQYAAHYENNKSIRLLTFDFTGHGNSAHRTVKDPKQWEDYTREDLFEVLREANVVPSPSSPVIGIGHSFGAVGMILAELKHPCAFQHIFAFEPVIPPLELMLKWKDNEELPLYKGALRRKFSWKNKDEAIRYFLSKPLFSSFHTDAFNGYLETGLVPSTKEQDGSVHLACAPSFEAQIYRGHHDGYERLPSLTSCPVHVIAGGDEPQGLMAFNYKYFQKIAARIPNSQFVKVDGTGHFLVMDKPFECAKVIAEGLQWKTGSS